MTRKRKWLFLGVAAIVGLQLLRPDRVNHPVENSQTFEEYSQAPPHIRKLLSRACLDCHSNQTRWPWYSRLAPASWVVADDVNRARREMNFSVWEQNDREKMSNLLEEFSELVRSRDMPPWSYRLMHPESRLSEEEVKTLADWAAAERRRIVERQTNSHRPSAVAR